jgi:hypothetical protein
LDCGSDGFELPPFVRKRFRELPFFPAAKLDDSLRRRKAEAHRNSLPQSKPVPANYALSNPWKK